MEKKVKSQKSMNKQDSNKDEFLEIDHYIGSLLGLAIGDAVGTSVEGKPPHSFKKISGMVGMFYFCQFI